MIKNKGIHSKSNPDPNVASTACKDTEKSYIRVKLEIKDYD